MTVKVIDISHWQSITSWANIKASGVLAVIAKATEGTNYLDPTFANTKAACGMQGLAFGAYHFLRPGNVDAQMNWFGRNTKGVIRLVIDFEDPKCDLDDLKTAIASLEKYRPDAEICIYTGSSFIIDLLGGKPDATLSKYPLWVAHYTSAAEPKWPKQVWPTWSLWQYTDKGTISGIAGAVDCNKWNGSDANLAKWFSAPTPQPQPEPEPEPELTHELWVYHNPSTEIHLVADESCEVDELRLSLTQH